MGRALMVGVTKVAWALALLVAVAAHAPSNTELAFDDGVLDDLGIDAAQSPDIGGNLYHEDAGHMSDEDVQQASKVFDVLYPSDDEGDLGESAGTMEGAAKENLDEARKARSEATKELLKAKGEAATQKAEKDLKKAEQGVEKAKQNVEKKLEKAKEEEREARKKILSAKGLEATEEATKEMEKAKKKVDKDKKKAEALGVKKESSSNSKARSKQMKKDIFKDKMK